MSDKLYYSFQKQKRFLRWVSNSLFSLRIQIGYFPYVIERDALFLFSMLEFTIFFKFVYRLVMLISCSVLKDLIDIRCF